MKQFKKAVTVFALILGTTLSMNAQDKMMKKVTKTISLEQVSGEFVQKGISVSPGSYVFEIHNNEVGHDVGFVLVKKGKDLSKPENHIKAAYVTEKVATGKTQRTNIVTLEKGEYVYFCPLNPTSTDNVLTVK